MKFFVVLFTSLLVVWRWRTARSTRKLQEKHRPAQQQMATVDMVPCAHCGLHLPASEATTGLRGVYCGPEHHRAAEP